MNENSISSVEGDFGLGADIVEISRFKGLYYDSPFIKRIFTKSESYYCYQYPDAASHLAATFAGKEAVLKAISSKITISLSKIEILRDTSGVPYVKLGEDIDFKIIISLSHSKNHAIAVALAIPQSHITNTAMFHELLIEVISELNPEK